MKSKKQPIQPHPQPQTELAAFTRPTPTTLVCGLPHKYIQDDDFTIMDDTGAPVFVVGGGKLGEFKEPRTISSPSGPLLLTIRDVGTWKRAIFSCEAADGQMFRFEPHRFSRKLPIVYPDGAPLAVLKSGHSGRQASILMADTEVACLQLHIRIRDGLLGRTHPPDTFEVQPGTSLLLIAAVSVVYARLRLAASQAALAGGAGA